MRRLAFVLVVTASAAACGGGAPPLPTGGHPSGGSGGTGRFRRHGRTGRCGRVNGRARHGRRGAVCPGSEPTAADTGVPPGVALTVVNHDVTVSQDGTAIDAQDIHGFLIIVASDVRVTRSIVRGRAIALNAGVIRINSGSNILIEDAEVAVGAPSANVDGMWVDNFVARRMDIHGGVDGMKAGSNTTVECSYLHDQCTTTSTRTRAAGPRTTTRSRSWRGPHPLVGYPCSQRGATTRPCRSRRTSAPSARTWSRTGPTAAAAPSTSRTRAPPP